VRPPAQSGIAFGRSARLLTVRLEDPSTRAALSAVGLEVLYVRHPLPACERIRVTKPLVVVIGPSVRSFDVDLVVEAASLVSAPVIEAWSTNSDWLVSEVRRALSSVSALAGALGDQQAVVTAQ